MPNLSVQPYTQPTELSSLHREAVVGAQGLGEGFFLHSQYERFTPTRTLYSPVSAPTVHGVMKASITHSRNDASMRASIYATIPYATFMNSVPSRPSRRCDKHTHQASTLFVPHRHVSSPLASILVQASAMSAVSALGAWTMNVSIIRAEQGTLATYHPCTYTYWSVPLRP